MILRPCTHRPPCPGCPRYGERGIAAAARATLETLAAETGARLDPVVEGEATGFRVRARLAVRGRATSPKLGIFQEGSHAIVDIPNCTIHHPRVNLAARAIRDAIRGSGVAPYSEKTGRGLLRYVQIVVERPTGRLQIVLVANDDEETSLRPLATRLEGLLADRLQGLWWNGNTSGGNAIFGSHWKLLSGAEAVEESIGGARVFFPPGAFGQSNLDLADRIVDELHARVADGQVVAEFHGGVGAIGLGLVPRSRELRCNELSPQGLRGLELGIAALPEGSGSRVRAFPGEAALAAAMLDGADVAIVDPPRKGLDQTLVAALREQRPRQLLYLSCDPQSLHRDARLLTAGAALRVLRLTPFAVFPYTEHVETLAELAAATD